MFPFQSQVDAFNGHKKATTKILPESILADVSLQNQTVIKNPDYLSQWWSMLRMIKIPNMKFIQLGDVMRWFDEQFSRSVKFFKLYSDFESQCSVRYDDNDRLQIQSSIEYTQGMLEKVLNDKASLADLPAALSSRFNWPTRNTASSKSLTDVCTTPSHPHIKRSLEAQFPELISYLQQQNHWLPPSLTMGISACDADIQ